MPAANPAAARIPVDKLPAQVINKLPPVISPEPPLNLIESSDLHVYGTEGNDHIIGTATEYQQTLYGLGGNDLIVLSTFGGGIAVGDNVDLYGLGGNDTLAGGTEGYSQLHGDAFFMYENAVGGDDILLGGASGNRLMYGDAYVMYAGTQGGDDRLVSGSTSEQMWGDAYSMAVGAVGGADTFVFSGQFGPDAIFDFRRGDGDKIEIDLDADVPWQEQVSWEIYSAGPYGNSLLIHVDSETSDGSITLLGSGIFIPGQSDFIFV